MMFGRRTGPEESYPVIDRALDAGINFLDTADVYARGESEEITGEALKRSGKRDRVVLATKVHGKMDPDDPNSSGNSARHIIAGCEASLRRLKTDYIDLYQIHRPQSDIPVDETLKALDQLVRSGKVRYAGASTHAAWQLMESIMVSREYGLTRYVCEQPPYNLLDRRIERELIPFALTYGLGLIPWSPLAGGLLTGKYRKDEPLPPDSRFTGIAESKQQSPQTRRMSPAFWEIIGEYIAFCEKLETSPARVALAWVINQPGITSPIIGPRNLEQLEEYLKVLEVQLKPEDLVELDRIFPPGRMTSPYYNSDFGPHEFRC